jgi:hypothetical protein
MEQINLEIRREVEKMICPTCGKSPVFSNNNDFEYCCEPFKAKIVGKIEEILHKQVAKEVASISSRLFPKN